ncbi:MAG: DUF1232 domain-containing protein [Nitrospirae bacterium]|nr:DUF1232 domain-containing protein [Nitrospirota bacterium]
MDSNGSRGGLQVAMKSPSETFKALQGRLLKKGQRVEVCPEKPEKDVKQSTTPIKPPAKSLKLSLLLMLLALVYDISPVDIIPDYIPVIGWMDDFFVTTAAALNVVHALVSNQNSALTRLVGILKWMVIFVGIIAVCLVLISMLGIIKLIMG